MKNGCAFAGGVVAGGVGGVVVGGDRDAFVAVEAVTELLAELMEAVPRIALRNSSS
jgi:hypothetical protein